MPIGHTFSGSPSDPTYLNDRKFWKDLEARSGFSLAILTLSYGIIFQLSLLISLKYCLYTRIPKYLSPAETPLLKRSLKFVMYKGSQFPSKTLVSPLITISEYGNNIYALCQAVNIEIVLVFSFFFFLHSLF